MNTALPFWLQVSQALLTPLIGVIAIGIAYVQWRTAHQRAVVELFEKRMAIYDGIRAAMSEVLREGKVLDTTPREFQLAIDRVCFLFGPEIQTYLDDLYRLLIAHRAADKLRNQRELSDEEVARGENAYVERWERFSAFFEEFPQLIKPYVQMHQRMPRL